jgi:protein arginine N-methyltransferase 1
MLEDHKRTGAYYNACIQNRAQFAGKVVLDVGTGSGILAIFAAKAGAKKVYAVEATSMAQQAKALIQAQGLQDTIEVIQGVVESVELPQKVDIIISEWMGYFLLRESMLDSVLLARDKFLRPGGALYPSHAKMYMAPIRTNASYHRSSELDNAMEGWKEFTGDMKEYYDVDLTVLTDTYKREQADYYLQTSAWCDVNPGQLMGPPVCFKEYDLLTVTVDEIKAPLKACFNMKFNAEGDAEAFVGFFDVTFAGSTENPADCPVVLTTAPDATGATHWGQQCFFLCPPVTGVSQSDVLECDFEMVRRTDNHRLMAVQLKHKLVTGGGGVRGEQRVDKFNIE